MDYLRACGRGGFINGRVELVRRLWRSKRAATHLVVVAVAALSVAIAAPQAKPTPPREPVSSSILADVGTDEIVGQAGDRLSLGVAREAHRSAPTSRALEPARDAAVGAANTTESVAASETASSKTGQQAFRTYVVQPGDTVGEVAERFGISANTLIWANGLDDNPDRLKVGQELLVPPVSGVTHTVAQGDTVAGLANHYEVDSSVIIQANGLTEPYLIKPGQTIFIPGGVKPPPTAGVATGRFMWPTYGRITSYFRQDGYHKGLDIGNGYGTPIYAADGGVVTTALKLSNSYGWHIIIDHGNGFSTLYAHLSKMYVDYGDRVRRGDIIGLMGSTGYSTGPHLHFEVRLHGGLCDPLDYLP